MLGADTLSTTHNRELIYKCTIFNSNVYIIELDFIFVTSSLVIILDCAVHFGISIRLVKR